MSKRKPSRVTNDVADIVLPEVLDLVAAPALREQLLEVFGGPLAEEGSLCLDGHKVERLTTPCAQVLLAADLMARDKGQRLRLSAASPALIGGLQQLGLKATLAEWEN